MGKQVAPVVDKIYDFILWVIPKLEKFPRSQKFLLADRIENMSLDILEFLIEANYSQKRAELLERVNLKIDKLRFLMRIAQDIKCIDLRAFEYQARAVDEIGRMVGGWRKAASL